jgi:hypothetical protein
MRTAVDRTEKQPCMSGTGHYYKSHSTKSSHNRTGAIKTSIPEDLMFEYRNDTSAVMKGQSADARHTGAKKPSVPRLCSKKYNESHCKDLETIRTIWTSDTHRSLLCRLGLFFGVETGTSRETG